MLSGDIYSTHNFITNDKCIIEVYQLLSNSSSEYQILST